MMIQWMRTISLVVFCFWVTACSLHPSQLQPAPQAVAACKTACHAVLETCRSHCQNDCDCCRAASDKKTAKSYHVYKKEQCIQGFKPIRVMNAYRDPLECRKVTCDCSVDYRVCLQACQRPTKVKHASFK